VERALDAGAQVLMLPFFKTADEVRRFIDMVRGRAVVFPLLETPQAAEHVDEILALDGIDEILIGLNDLSLGYGKKFMFELLADGTLDRLCERFRKKGLPYGFGGIAYPHQGMVPAEKIIREHYRLGSTRVILSRSFCNSIKEQNLGVIAKCFFEGVREIRAIERECDQHLRFFSENREDIVQSVEKIRSKN